MSLANSKYELSVHGSTLRHALKVGKGFIQTSDVSEVLDNICLKESNGKLLFLAGTRIVFCRIESQPVSINDWKDTSIPGKVAQEIYSVIEDKGVVTLVSDGERLKAFNDSDPVNRFELISRLAAQPYPNVEVYFAKEEEGTSRVIINNSDLSDTVDRSKMFSGHEKFSVVTLRGSQSNNQEIIVVADDPDTGKSYEEVIPITNVDSAVLDKSFNSEMLSKVLKQCDTGEILLKFNPVADLKKGGAMVFITPNVDGAEKGTLRFIIMTLK
jgi:DNA polymerase III sliding clamp (beta) subunit (PCNA family)